MIVDIDLSRINVLIVDTSRYSRSFIRSALQSFGVGQVMESADANEAMPILARHRIDLILADHGVTPDGGVEFVRGLRSQDGSVWQDIPVIMVSSLADMEKVLEARNVGTNEFLVKPVSPESLYRRVRTVLVNPRPFVRSPDYVGPCRRLVDRPAATGIDRRVAPPLSRPRPLIDLPPGITRPRAAETQSRAENTPAPTDDRTVRKRFRAGTAIFREGDAGDAAYVVETGRVSIVKSVDDTDTFLGEILPHGIFGEMALIDDHPRMASAIAAEDTVCMVIPKAAMKAQINRTPDLVILVVETLLHDIRKMGRELVEARARVSIRRDGPVATVT